MNKETANEREHRCAAHRGVHLFSEFDVTACIGCVMEESAKMRDDPIASAQKLLSDFQILCDYREIDGSAWRDAKYGLGLVLKMLDSIKATIDSADSPRAERNLFDAE